MKVKGKGEKRVDKARREGCSKRIIFQIKEHRRYQGELFQSLCLVWKWQKDGDC